MLPRSYGVVWKPSGLRRRELYPDLSPELQKQFDLLDFANAQLPQDCIGFVVEP